MTAPRPAFGIEERPDSLLECVLYGWQHTLVDISPFILPLPVAAALGFSAADTAQLVNLVLLSMGVATLIQTSVGNRLPIIQGPSATLTATMAPVATQFGPAALWGGVMLGAALETMVGATGVLGRLRRWFPPAVAGAVVAAIGLALSQLAVRLSLGDGRLSNVAFALGVLGLILVLQRLGRNIWGGLVGRAAIFLSIWIVGLGVGSLAGMVDWQLVADKPWFQLPRLFPHGGPGFGWQLSLAASLALFAGYLGSMIESVGDYVATCDAAGETFTEQHVNRGIFAEGLGCLSSSVLGGLPCTSYTQNIGIIATTGVASRFVVRIAAVILMAYGLCPKFGALLVALPRPVLGGVFLLVCGLIIASGIEIAARDLDRPAARITVGLTLAASVAVPTGIDRLGDEWLAQVPDLGRLILTNPVVLAVAIAVALHAAQRRGHLVSE